jgi:tetratricopeptide (TPR) repeat protein
MLTLSGRLTGAETITQTTTGWCSPVVNKAGGNVTIICQGVDPKALDRLNELLDKKDLELEAKIQEAEEWAQKYRHLQQRLTEEGRDSVLAQQAQALLEEGKLEEAGEVLDRLLDSGERLVEQIASDHFNRAAVYALQFQLHKALSHYEKAYRYRPDNVEYAFWYALTLQKQNSYSKAETVYSEVLTAYRQLAQDNPQAYLPYLALTLNNLGILYSDTQQLSESAHASQEALTIKRQLARDNEAYLPNVAMTLTNLGVLYRRMQQLSESAHASQEALDIYQQLARDNEAYLPNVAMTLTNLGVLYRDMQQLSESAHASQEALDIYRQLAEDNPQPICLTWQGRSTT